MNLKTARSAKQATEAAIVAALQDFTETTGLRVDRLDIECLLSRSREACEYCEYTVSMEARL